MSQPETTPAERVSRLLHRIAEHIADGAPLPVYIQTLGGHIVMPVATLNHVRVWAELLNMPVPEFGEAFESGGKTIRFLKSRTNYVDISCSEDVATPAAVASALLEA